jgi:hypothetical protein
MHKGTSHVVTHPQYSASADLFQVDSGYAKTRYSFTVNSNPTWSDYRFFQGLFQGAPATIFLNSSTVNSIVSPALAQTHLEASSASTEPGESTTSPGASNGIVMVPTHGGFYVSALSFSISSSLVEVEYDIVLGSDWIDACHPLHLEVAIGVDIIERPSTTDIDRLPPGHSWSASESWIDNTNLCELQRHNSFLIAKLTDRQTSALRTSLPPNCIHPPPDGLCRVLSSKAGSAVLTSKNIHTMSTTTPPGQHGSCPAPLTPLRLFLRWMNLVRHSQQGGSDR